MQTVQPTEKRLGALTLHTVNTSKYKTNTMVLKLKAPLTEKNVTKRALLPYVLKSATAHSPSAKELQRRLDDLYGASLSAHLSKKGDAHIISMKLEVANEKYLSSNAIPLLDEALQLLAEVLCQPKLEEGLLSEDIISKEKRMLKQRIEAVRDDKMRYASTRLIEEMCKKESYHLHPLGREEDIDAISATSLTTYYRETLAASDIDLYIVGDIDEQNVTSLVEGAFPLIVQQTAPWPQMASSTPAVNEETVVTEMEDIEQAKLNLGYRTYTTYNDDDYYALQVFNGIFGGFPHSKLFINVREKASLAYYTTSQIESHKGLLLVFSGIESSNYDQAVTIMKEQMAKMRRGEFSDEEFQQTKAMLHNQLLETFDNAKGVIEFSYNGAVVGYERTADDWLQGMNAVTKEDVTAIANKVVLDTIYFLKGKEGSS